MSKQSRIINAVTAMVGVCLLVACGTNMPKSNPQLQDAGFYQKKLADEWAKVERAVTYVDKDHAVVVEAPQRIPDSIYNKQIKTQMASNAKVADVAAILQMYGVYLMIPEDEVRTKPINIIGYNGKLGDFLRAIGASYGIAFNWNPGEIMTAETTSEYVLRVPQDKTLLDTVEKAITTLGAQDIHASLIAGTVSYRAGYSANQRIVNYIERTALNSSLVSMQVAIINVALNRDQTSGFDWTKLQAKFGDATIKPVTSTSGGDNSNNGNSGNNGNGNNGGTSGNGNSGSGSNGSNGGNSTPQPLGFGTNLKDLHSFVGLAAEGLTLRFAKDDFDVSALIGALSSYGKTETTQSMMMKTLSGHDVKLTSGQTIPYLESIGVSSTGNNNGASNNGNGLLGSANIKDLKVGLELDLEPVYDYATDIVTIGVNIKLSALIKMVEISAGNQIGTVTRPNTQENNFNDVVKVSSGQSVLIGGLTYYQNEDTRNNLAVLDNLDAKTASWGNKWTKSAMFILLRPTITVFGKGPAELADASEARR